MCRLFLSYHQSDVENLLKLFLETQISKIPSSPKVEPKCRRNDGPNKDGFGIAWHQNGKWMIYKKDGVYSDDTQLDNVLVKIPENTIVLGHIRRKSDGDAEYENTHPFIHKNAIFMHNGKVIDFAKHRNAILKKIAPKYRHQIMGETDSEVLFYLFLSCIVKPSSRKTLKKSRSSRKIQHAEPYVHRAFLKMSHILRTLGVSWIGNIMYADKTYILITRYSESSCPAPSLYTNRIGITSDPLDGSSVLIPENTILVRKIG